MAQYLVFSKTDQVYLLFFYTRYSKNNKSYRR